jgi:hypothetical protein
MSYPQYTQIFSSYSVRYTPDQINQLIASEMHKDENDTLNSIEYNVKKNQRLTDSQINYVVKKYIGEKHHHYSEFHILRIRPNQTILKKYQKPLLQLLEEENLN